MRPTDRPGVGLVPATRVILSRASPRTAANPRGFGMMSLDTVGNGRGPADRATAALVADRVVRWDIASDPEVWHAPDVRHRWAELLAECDDVNNPYRSAEWFDHWHALAPPHEVMLAVARDQAGRPVWLAPLRRRRQSLPFAAS